MGKIIEMPPKTYRAKLFEVSIGGSDFKVAGTLDGCIDLATTHGTYQLTEQEAFELAQALIESVKDVHANCLYDKDPLLKA